jgi:hypothetical protein
LWTGIYSRFQNLRPSRESEDPSGTSIEAELWGLTELGGELSTPTDKDSTRNLWWREFWYWEFSEERLSTSRVRRPKDDGTLLCRGVPPTAQELLPLLSCVATVLRWGFGSCEASEDRLLLSCVRRPKDNGTILCCGVANLSPWLLCVAWVLDSRLGGRGSASASSPSLSRHGCCLDRRSAFRLHSRSGWSICWSIFLLLSVYKTRTRKWEYPPSCSKSSWRICLIKSTCASWVCVSDCVNTRSNQYQ